jgi:hypothetical protein
MVSSGEAHFSTLGLCAVGCLDRLFISLKLNGRIVLFEPCMTRYVDSMSEGKSYKSTDTGRLQLAFARYLQDRQSKKTYYRIHSFLCEACINVPSFSLPWWRLQVPSRLARRQRRLTQVLPGTSALPVAALRSLAPWSLITTGVGFTRPMAPPTAILVARYGS